MAKLILSFEGKVEKEYELDQEIVTIGRKPGNDIQIDNMAVSGTHAKILTIMNDSFIEDLNSTNGTLINGQKISKHSLQSGETIVLGQHELKYINEAAEAGEGEFEKTMIIRPGTSEAPVSSETSKKLEQSIGKIAADIASQGAAGSKEIAAHLTLLSGGNAGKEMKLTKILTTLGKPGIQVAAITRRPLGYFLIVVDAGNSGRPIVNDKEVGTQATPLVDSDVIEVAGVKMGFYVEE
jgi:pSer/pThr/pTyr-binding forkhead associated (FHA) protein